MSEPTCEKRAEKYSAANAGGSQTRIAVAREGWGYRTFTNGHGMPWTWSARAESSQAAAR